MRDLREHRQRKANIKACSVCLAFLAIFAATGREAGGDFEYADTLSAPFLMSTVLDRPMPGMVTSDMSLRELVDPTAQKINDHKFVKYANYVAAEEREALKAVITQAVTKQEHDRDPYYYMHERVVYPSSKHLNKRDGVCYGPSGRETYYNLDMRPVVQRMRSLGYSAKDYPYWVRSDGVKMLGPYVMVAANFRIRPRGTILECSLGTAIVCDTGGFIRWAPKGLDVAVNW
ncbi:hypothetical protein SAMN02910456_01619 [Ruminococcaceae bacterium YRB3002]|nr:hypothetical protein SAMN02910456_01619 [Ruminococcaceae bacterium YRB3002]